MTTRPRSLLDDIKDAAERKEIVRLLHRYNWVKVRVYTYAGISRNGLWRKMQKHGIPGERPK